ncbi:MULTISPECIES: hypothetical protein [unclassified Caballeronia]|uniref:hypothetical protein n=1 Tax=unclassified Caballeronia TaxID=2646786 RepID=UPI001F497900|nr:MULTISPECIES: hypothetical protein [unclassified Caballeronia]
MSMLLGAFSKNVCKASTPPADAPIPTTGNRKSLLTVTGESVVRWSVDFGFDTAPLLV